MADFKAIKKLYEYVKTLRQSEFNMNQWFEVKHLSKKMIQKYGNEEAIARRVELPIEIIRKDGPCRTAACLAGSAVIRLGKRGTRISGEGGYTISALGRKLLGLNDDEARFMFMGQWAPPSCWDEHGYGDSAPNWSIHLDLLTKKHALAYLKRVLKEKNVFVRLED